jgi:uncharacterized protein
MLQTWRVLTFIHWRYDPALIARFIPKPLQLDTFEGSAWIGLTPFVLDGIRLPYSPALPWISRFPETNVRTYVKGPDGIRSVWFFTLEADRLLGVLAARALYGLPYRWSRMRVDLADSTIRYQSERNSPFGRGYTDVTIEPGSSIKPGPLENFLTARYRLYAKRRGALVAADIFHEPWSLRTARILHLDQNLVEHSGVPRPKGDITIHHSTKIDVRIGRLRLAF